MEIGFIHTESLVHLHVNKTNFHMKGFTLGLALKQRRKATRKSSILSSENTVTFQNMGNTVIGRYMYSILVYSEHTVIPVSPRIC